MDWATDPRDGRFKCREDFLTVAQAQAMGYSEPASAVPVPVAPARVERVYPIEEYDPSFPTRRAPVMPTAPTLPHSNQAAPAPVAAIDYSACPKCAIRHEASRRKNLRQRARKKARAKK